MLTQIIIISLIITGIYATMQPGMIFDGLSDWIMRKLQGRWSILINPICGCLTCMGGLYTLILYPLLFGWSWHVLPVMCGVIGANFIVSTIITKLRDE